MILEIVTTTAEETLFAKEHGADRVELVSGITEGALTPTYGSLKGVYEDVKVPAFCMIRPHNHGFVYSELDVKEMITDIENQRDYASVLVLGCLTADNEIDEVTLAKLLAPCKDVPVTFHKAIDMTKDFKASLKILAKYPQIKRVLTNFGLKDIKNSQAEIEENLAYCDSLGLTVTFAGGVSLEVLPTLKAAGVKEFHISSAARIDGLAKNKLCPTTLDALAAAK